MNRRNFIKATAAGVVGLFLVRKTKAKTIDVPSLPTLEFLQEHNPDIEFFQATYSTRGTWDGFAWRRNPSGKKLSSEEHRALLFFENGEWFAVDKQWRESGGLSRLRYYNKIDWPNWLRKF